MHGYAVEPAALLAGDVVLGSAVAQARDELAQLQSCAEPVRGSWCGSAGVAFREGWAQWLAGITAMLEALDELAALLGASGDAYAANEDAVRGSLLGGVR